MTSIRIRPFRCGIVSGFAALAVMFVVANAAQAERRPKIGLVLKGGGALGFAHVGVLKVLEQNRVPVDAIAGTSMGSIVGAAYASGATMEEMETTLSETHWGELFGEKVQRPNLDYRLRGGRGRELYGDAKLSYVDGKFITPKGVVEGQNIRLLFTRLFRNPPSPVKFDSLPVPFRAVTADVETGEAYVPDQGDLLTVVRASMSIPGAFSPVEIDGRLLVDGGISDNLPVDIALKMGVDTLIVVDLKSDLPKRAALTSPIALSSQMISLLLMQNSTLSRKLVRPHDVVIEPDVSGFGVGDFPKALELMAIGEKKALESAALLKKLSISEAEYQKYSSKRTRSRELPEHIAFVRYKNDSRMSEARIAELFGLKEGDPFDPEKIEEGIGRVYQTGYFTNVKYSTVHEGESSGLTVEATGKDWLSQYVRLGFSISDNLEGDNNFRFGAAFRTYDVGSKDSYLETQFEIGRFPRIALEYYHPLAEDSPYFIAPRASYGLSSLNITDGDEILAEYNRTEGLGTFALGRRVGMLGEATLDFSRGFGRLSRHIGDPSLQNFDYETADVSTILDLDTLDRPDFPTSGFRLNSRFSASVDELGAPNNFQEVAGSFSVPLTSGRDTIILRNSFVSTFGDRPIERLYSLGGFANISGALESSLAASDFYSASMIGFHRFSEVENPFFDLAFFGGGTFELSSLQNSDPRFRDYSRISSGSLFVGADTPLVPVYVGFGLNNLGENSFYISIGRLAQPNR